jgi:hypothetical protein
LLSADDHVMLESAEASDCEIRPSRFLSSFWKFPLEPELEFCMPWLPPCGVCAMAIPSGTVAIAATNMSLRFDMSAPRELLLRSDRSNPHATRRRRGGCRIAAARRPHGRSRRETGVSRGPRGAANYNTNYMQVAFAPTPPRSSLTPRGGLRVCWRAQG